MYVNQKSSMEGLGRLVQVDPREVWKHEAHDFTPWLIENADQLAEALGIEIGIEASEHAVGASIWTSLEMT
jgi:hypothetical protein